MGEGLGGKERRREEGKTVIGMKKLIKKKKNYLTAYKNPAQLNLSRAL